MLELKNVSYIVEGDKEILNNVSLSLDEKFVAITGPNGSGKSTPVSYTHLTLPTTPYV